MRAYLNFMGNEWGHPEWIDFPREGNGWSYKYARRQWDLVDREDLKYQFLNNWDNDMIHLIGGVKGFESLPVRKLWDKDDDQVLAYMRGDLVFVFNFSPNRSHVDYPILAPEGEYVGVFDSDNERYGGYGNIDEDVKHLTEHDGLYAAHHLGWLKLYLPARSAQVLRLKPCRNILSRKCYRDGRRRRICHGLVLGVERAGLRPVDEIKFLVPLRAGSDGRILRVADKPAAGAIREREVLLRHPERLADRSVLVVDCDLLLVVLNLRPALVGPVRLVRPPGRQRLDVAFAFLVRQRDVAVRGRVVQGLQRHRRCRRPRRRLCSRRRNGA